MAAQDGYLVFEPNNQKQAPPIIQVGTEKTKTKHPDSHVLFFNRLTTVLCMICCNKYDLKLLT